MARFRKTTLHVVSAVLILLGLYALAGLGYAAWVHNGDSMMFWTLVAAGGFGAAIANQVFQNRKRRRAP